MAELMAFGMNGSGAPQNNHLDSIWPRREMRKQKERRAALYFLLCGSSPRRTAMEADAPLNP
jgi:hypothetical protein